MKTIKLNIKPNEDATTNEPDKDKKLDEEKTDIKKEEPKQEPEENVLDPLEKYQVFSECSLDHPGYLSEARTFYEIDQTNYILAYGHHAHTTHKYELSEVKDSEIIMIRSVVEDADYERIESITRSDNWQEEITKYLLEEVEPMEKTFFSFDAEQPEIEVSVDGQTYTLYPVNVSKDKTYFFMEGHGLGSNYMIMERQSICTVKNKWPYE